MGHERQSKGPSNGHRSFGDARAAALYQLRPGVFWQHFKKQHASFWFLNFFVFLEYVRPQSIWTELAVFPWSAVTLTLCVVSFLAEGQRMRLDTIADKWLGIFTAVWLMSCITAFSPSLSFDKSWGYLSWLLMYVLIVNIVTTKDRFFIFLFLFFLYNVKMSQHGVRTWAQIGFGFSDWGATGAPGWFQNSGEFGIEMTIFFPLSLLFWRGLRQYWSKAKSLVMFAFPLTAAVSIIASSSRGALIGGAAGMAVLLAHSKYKVRAAVVAAATVVLVFAVLPPEQKVRLQNMGDDKTSTRRTDLWKIGLNVARERPVFGAGYANWIEYNYAKTGKFIQLPHNMFMEALAELGYTGLLSFLGLIGATVVVNARTRKLARRLPGDQFLRTTALGLDAALAGSLVSGFFVTVLYYPFFWMNLALSVALYRATLNEVKRAALPATTRPSAGPPLRSSAQAHFPVSPQPRLRGA